MPTRKRILVVTTRYPFPPSGGDKLRVTQLLDILSQEYDVALATLYGGRAPAPPEPSLRLASIVAFRQPRLLSWLSCLAGLLSSRPLQLFYYFNPRLRRHVRQHAHAYDAIVLHLARSMVFLPKGYSGRVILEATDCMTLHYERARGYSRRTLRGIFYRMIEEARMRRFERTLAGRFDAVSVISEIDRDWLVALDPGLREQIRVFPNYIRPLCYQPAGQERRRILFIGNMSALHVLDAAIFFASQVMPRLVARHPGLDFLVIGQIPPRAARRLRRQPKVEVLGPVVRIDDHVDHLLCGIAPMRFASGVQNKVIDYMSLGIPALVSAVALEGIPARPHEEVLVCESAQDYVRAIDRLLADPELWQRLGARGKAFAHNTYRREVVVAEVLASFRELLQDDARSSSVV